MSILPNLLFCVGPYRFPDAILLKTKSLRLNLGSHMAAQIFYNAFTQFENLGDQIINRELLRLLRQHGQLIVNVGGAPRWYLQAIQIQESEKVGPVRFLVHIAMAGLWRGRRGYFFTKPGHTAPSHGFSGLRTSLLRLVRYSLLNRSGIKVCRLGFSISENTGVARAFETAASKHFFFAAVRDSYSWTVGSGMSYHGLRQMPDLSLMLTYRGDKCDKKNAIGVSFRSVERPLEPGLQELVAEAEASHALRCFIQVGRDRAFMERLLGGRRIDSVPNDASLQAQKIEELYGACRFVISNRLHCLLVGMSYGALPIAVCGPGENKISALLRDLGFGYAIISLEDPVGRVNAVIEEYRRFDKRRIRDIFSRCRGEIATIAAEAFRE
jgi:hypothetical protein